MKLARKKLLLKKKKTTAIPKKSFDFNEFRSSFESLDNENYGSWPVPVKVTILVLICALLVHLPGRYRSAIKLTPLLLLKVSSKPYLRVTVKKNRGLDT